MLGVGWGVGVGDDDELDECFTMLKAEDVFGSVDMSTVDLKVPKNTQKGKRKTPRLGRKKRNKCVIRR